MKKLITKKRWKDYLRKRQAYELTKHGRTITKITKPREVRPFISLNVPMTFSFIKNPDPMANFIRKLVGYLGKYNIDLDLTNVNEITPDAIAALAANITHLSRTSVRGNMPENQQAKKTLIESGFFAHVLNSTPIPKGKYGTINEHQNQFVESKTARELIMCAAEQAFGSYKCTEATRAAFRIILELMINTHNHAGGKRKARKMWWATSFGDSTQKKACYTFLDTGVGIFKSIHMSYIIKTLNRLGITHNYDIMRQILQGEIPSSTGLPYRGYGLPKIYAKLQAGSIKSLYIITNDVYADVKRGIYRTLNPPFKGTLVHWESEA